MGMGDGAITKILLQDAKLDVTGIDNEPKMIEQARKALRASIASGRLTVVLDDALHYLAARPQHSLDIVASGYVLHNLTANYRERLYDEIWRVLAPAGLLINADKIRPARGSPSRGAELAARTVSRCAWELRAR